MPDDERVAGRAHPRHRERRGTQAEPQDLVRHAGLGARQQVAVAGKPASSSVPATPDLGFNDPAHLDDGDMWPTEFALPGSASARPGGSRELVRRAAKLTARRPPAGARPERRTPAARGHRRASRRRPRHRAPPRGSTAPARSGGSVAVGRSRVDAVQPAPRGVPVRSASRRSHQVRVRARKEVPLRVGRGGRPRAGRGPRARSPQPGAPEADPRHTPPRTEIGRSVHSLKTDPVSLPVEHRVEEAAAPEVARDERRATCVEALNRQVWNVQALEHRAACDRLGKGRRR